MRVKVGFAKIDITPPLGIVLGGQLHEKRATYVESNLYAMAMCIENVNGVSVFVSCDLLVITTELAECIKRLVCSQLPIKSENIFVSATHTHSGPITVPIFGMQTENLYVDELPPKIYSVIEQAYNNRDTASLFMCSTQAKDICFNRRFIMKDGSVQTHPLKGDPNILNPEGPDDSHVGVMYAKDNQGNVLGGFVNFACHGTVMDRYDTGISADYPGYVCRSMQKQFGEDTTWLFLNGACGNLCQVNVFDPDKKEVGADWAKHMGNCIAQAASDAVQNGEHTEIKNITIISKTIHVSFRKVPEDLVQKAKKILENNPSISEPPNLSNYGIEHFADRGKKVALENIFTSDFWDKFYAREILTLKEESQKTPIVDVPISVIKATDFALVTVPGELFVEWGLEIKRRSPCKYTFVAELTNGYVGYIPTEKAFSHKGGYETKFVTSTKLCENAGKIITEGALRLFGVEEKE